jgi:hypothetical protein
VPYYIPADPEWGSAKPKNNMKNEITILAVSLGLTGTAAYLLSRANPAAVTADSLIGFGVVLALIAMAALEYRLTWKKLIGR